MEECVDDLVRIGGATRLSSVSEECDGSYDVYVPSAAGAAVLGEEAKPAEAEGLGGYGARLFGAAGAWCWVADECYLMTCLQTVPV